jgi:hypothetical protein
MSRFRTESTLAAIRRAGVEQTLDAWLQFNMLDADTVDAELLELVPAAFEQELEDRIRLSNEYDQRLAAQRGSR